MVLKELKWVEKGIVKLLAEGRLAVKVQVLKFPGTAAHRLKQTHRQPPPKDRQFGKK